MGVRQVRKAFTKALRERGFSISDDEAFLKDGHIQITFGGSEWYLHIGGVFIGSHPMEAGSMEALKKFLSRQGEKIPERR